jgi:tRNA 2-thiouridine synthesizing protein A
LEDLPAGAVLEVLADDPVTRRDLPSWAREMGHRVLEEADDGNAFRFLLQKGGNP